MTKVMEEPRLKIPRIVKVVDPSIRVRVTVYLTQQELRDAKIVAAQMGLHLVSLGREAIRKMIYVNPAAETEIKP
jgi:hypothetical protein